MTTRAESGKSPAWRRALDRQLPPGWRKLLPFVPPVVLYTLWALAPVLPFGGGPLATSEGTAPPTVLGAYVSTLGATAMSNLAVYLLYAFSWERGKGLVNPLTGLGFVAFCGTGILAVAFPTRGLVLVPLAIQVAFMPRGRRFQPVLEYGSTGLSLAWFHSNFEKVGILPWGIPIAIAQGAMLLYFASEWKDADPRPAGSASE